MTAIFKLEKMYDSLLNVERKIISNGLEYKMRQFHPWGYIFFHQKLNKTSFPTHKYENLEYFAISN